jgi:hypothetical protein
VELYSQCKNVIFKATFIFSVANHGFGYPILKINSTSKVNPIVKQLDNN